MLFIIVKCQHNLRCARISGLYPQSVGHHVILSSCKSCHPEILSMASISQMGNGHWHLAMVCAEVLPPGAKFVTNAAKLELMPLAPPGGQTLNLCWWRHLVTNHRHTDTDTQTHIQTHTHTWCIKYTIGQTRNAT